MQFGVASHNLFDLCYAMLLADGSGGVRPDSAETPTGGEYLVVRAESGGAVIRL